MSSVISRRSAAFFFVLAQLAHPVDARALQQDESPNRTSDHTTAPVTKGATHDPGAAVEDQPPSIEELSRRLEILAAEVEQLRSGEAGSTRPLTHGQRAMVGLGPAAGTVYERKSGVSLAGYGEMLMQRPSGRNQSGSAAGASTSIDFLRAILFAGYRFNDRFLFNSEVEWEHGGKEVGVEFAYLEYAVKPSLSVRGGMLLVPLGLTNEFHEPTVLVGTRRPETETRILPSTWRENGVGVVGAAGRATYRAYVLNGMNAAGFSSSGVRGGRQSGAQALANDWAFAGRLDVNVVPGVFGGVGLYRGNSGQRQFQSVAVGTTISELHGQAQVRGFDLRGVFAHAAIEDAASLNRARGLPSGGGVGKSMNGGYAQAAYNLLSQTGSAIAVSPYYRFEQVNTQAAPAEGFLADAARNGRWHTLGLELKPIRNIVLKTDYQWVTNRARSGRNQLNLALGYAF